MKKINNCLYGILIFCSLFTSAQENLWTSGRPDGHAPMDVMGDHYHKKGEWMVSYRLMNMTMEGARSGKQDMATSVVHQSYMAAPKEMQMSMHMLGIMYAFSDQLTLMMMTNYSVLSMDLVNRVNASFSTESDGLGDLSLSALIKLYNQNRNSIHLQAGFSVPRGSIDQKGDTPIMSNTPLAYPMQLGSGTWDPIIGLTYLGQSSTLSWGWQSRYQIRIGENDNGYRLGDSFQTEGWGALKLSQKWSLATSLKYIKRSKIKGQYDALNPMMMPLFNATNSGGNQLNLGFSTNFYFPEGALKNFRLGVSYEIPLSQDTNGIQMANENLLTIGIQYSFKAKEKKEE